MGLMYLPQRKVRGVILNNFTWVLDLISSEKGIYLMSCRFINCEDGITRVFTGVFCLLKGENEKGFGYS